MIDQQERIQALDTSASYIVRAPAGSGKTEILVQRFMNALLTVDEPSQVVAITFTRKAASEMRERIIANLTAAQQKHPVTSEHQQRTRSIAERVMARDQALNWRLLLDPCQLQVTTIDSLAGRLTGLSGDASLYSTLCQITPLPTLLYEEAVDRYLVDEDYALPERDALLTQFDEYPERLKEVLCQLLACRDQWLHPLLDQQQSDLRTRASHSLRVMVEAYLHEIADDLSLFQTDKYRDFLRVCHTNQILSGEEFLDINQYKETLYDIGYQDVLTWKALAQLLLKQDGGIRQSYNRRQGILRPSQSGLSPYEKEERQAHKALAYELRDELMGQPEAHAALKAIHSLPTSSMSDEDYDLLQAIVGCLPPLLAELHVLMRERQIVDYTEVTLQAIASLQDEGEPSHANHLWSSRMHHLLVDEFQDTSISQYHLLSALTHTWSDLENHSVFLVGDPMQSIYRFRQAEVGVFHHCQTSGLGNMHLTPLTLACNFRTDITLVAAYNRAFAELMGNRACLLESQVTHEMSHGIRELPSSAWTGIELEGGAWQDVLTQTLEQVETWRLQKEVTSIAVLTRTRQQGAAISQCLTQADVANQTHGTHYAGDMPVIQDAITLTLALCNPWDRIHWLALLRSPCLALPWLECQHLAQDTDIPILDGLRQHSKHSLSSESRQRIEALLPLFEEAVDSIGQYRLDHIVQWFWQHSSLQSAYADTESQAMMKAFELALATYEPFDRPDNAEDLLGRTNALFNPKASPVNEGTVQVMTIHQAKGLEFDAVVVVGGDRPSPSRRLPLIWSCPVGDDWQDALLFPTRSLSDRHATDIHRFINHLEHKREENEQLRLLYVALTRARLHCVMIARSTETGENAPASPLPTSTLFGACWRQFERAGMQITTLTPRSNNPTDSVSSGAQDTQSLVRIPLGSILMPETPAAGDIVVDPGDPARRYGEILHAACHHLSQIQLTGESPITPNMLSRIGRSVMRQQAIPVDEQTQHQQQLEEDLTGMWGDPIGRWILSQHKQAYNEFKIPSSTDWDSPWIRVDRTFVDDQNIRWLIDYKTTSRDPLVAESDFVRFAQGYRQQVFQYRDAISEHLDRERRTIPAIYLPRQNVLCFWGNEGDEAPIYCQGELPRPPETGENGYPKR